MSTESRPFQDEHEEQFREKLKTFQKISSRGDLGSVDERRAVTAEDKKPPPPLKYKDLINVSRKYRARLKGGPQVA